MPDYMIFCFATAIAAGARYVLIESDLKRRLFLTGLWIPPPPWTLTADLRGVRELIKSDQIDDPEVLRLWAAVSHFWRQPAIAFVAFAIVAPLLIVLANEQATRTILASAEAIAIVPFAWLTASKAARYRWVVPIAAAVIGLLVFSGALAITITRS
jgi:hypothetical protein